MLSTVKNLRNKRNGKRFGLKTTNDATTKVDEKLQ
jgi:hypothetical protein